MHSSISQSTWQWRNYQQAPYLTCSLLQQWPHGFFTRQFSALKPHSLVEVLDPAASVAHLKQIHGNLVWKPHEINEDSLTEGDGLLTDGNRQSVWVASADCTPALIGDTRTGIVAAVHAGWRGTAQRILPVTLSRFQEAGSRLEDLRVALGPAISGRVYQVTQEVANGDFGGVDSDSG